MTALDIEHAALLVPPCGQLVKEHELLDVSASCDSAGQIGLQRGEGALPHFGMLKPVLQKSARKSKTFSFPG